MWCNDAGLSREGAPGIWPPFISHELIIISLLRSAGQPSNVIWPTICAQCSITVLEPGHLMLSGSFTRPVWANPGDTLHADFGALGGVSVQFV